MYAEYLSKVASKKQSALQANDVNMDTDNDNNTEEMKQATEMDIEMDLKDSKSKTMKTGEKYIIRKLISFKITIPKIDDYIGKLEQIKVKESMGDFQMFNNNNFFKPIKNEKEMMYNKTMQGFNDDSKIALQYQPSLFQQNMMPMPNLNSGMNFNNPLVAGMQGLNIMGPNHCYWDTNNLVNSSNTAHQMLMNLNMNQGINNMQMMQNNNQNQMDNNYGNPMMNMNMPLLNKSNMNDFVFGQQPMQNFNHQSAFTSTHSNTNQMNSINSAMVSMGMDDSTSAPMRMPLHMSKVHQRSNSVTPMDTSNQNYMNSNFLFDQLQPNPSMSRPVLSKV